jgi:cell division septation protein DedD
MMPAQSSHAHNPGLADFSAALLRANTTNTQRENADISTSRHQTAAHAYSTTANRNISSLVSQIRDDGPAGTGKSKPAPAVQGVAKSIPASDSRDDDMLDDDVVAISSMPGYSLDESNELLEMEMKIAQSARETRTSTWLHFVIIMLVTVSAVMGFIVFKLIGETGELRAAITHQLDTVAVMPAAAVETRSSAQLQQLLGSVETLSSELVAVNHQQKQLQDLVTAMIPDDFEQQLNQLSGIGHTVVGLQSDLSKIQQTVQSLKTEHTAGIEQKPVTLKHAIVKPLDAKRSATKLTTMMPSQVSAATENWIVNLASLSTQQQALSAVDSLRVAGIAPIIQETVVNGKQVYRLSVDGFTTRAAAQEFIVRARTRLGFPGGWARRAQS